MIPQTFFLLPVPSHIRQAGTTRTNSHRSVAIKNAQNTNVKAWMIARTHLSIRRGNVRGAAWLTSWSGSSSFSGLSCRASPSLLLAECVADVTCRTWKKPLGWGLLSFLPLPHLPCLSHPLGNGMSRRCQGVTRIWALAAFFQSFPVVLSLLLD